MFEQECVLLYLHYACHYVILSNSKENNNNDDANFFVANNNNYINNDYVFNHVDNVLNEQEGWNRLLCIILSN